jgi:hypothetical protein
MAGWSAILSGDGQDAERVTGARVTWDFFRTLGVTPAIGRDFEPAQDHPDRRRVALISDSLWRRRWGADPNVVGKAVQINQVTYTLAGVMPPLTNDLIFDSSVSGHRDLESPGLHARIAGGVSKLPTRLCRGTHEAWRFGGAGRG